MLVTTNCLDKSAESRENERTQQLSALFLHKW